MHEINGLPFLTQESLSEALRWKEIATEQGGAILIDKQVDWTSFDVVAKLRSLLKIKRIGHAGTLDPLATGLLIICVERKATRRIDEFQAQQKQYVATMKLGATTPSDDAEFPEENICSTDHVSAQQVRDVLTQFTGEIQQIPPMFSAIKKDGQPLYARARKGETIELQPRTVVIHDVQLISAQIPFFTLQITCSKGTYIRSLARDIGKILGVGGYLTQLRRTAIGDFSVENAVTIQQLMQVFRPENPVVAEAKLNDK